MSTQPAKQPKDKRTKKRKHGLQRRLTPKDREKKCARQSLLICMYWLRECGYDENAVEMGVIDFIILLRGIPEVCA